MEHRLLQYFKEEKQSALLFITIGSVTLVTGLLGYFYFQTLLWKGIAAPLLLGAPVQLFMGLSTYFRSDQQAKGLLQQLDQQPHQFITEELARMKAVDHNYQTFRKIGLSFFLMGFVFVLMGGISNWGPVVLGGGIGLTLQSSAMLVLDLFGELRASVYHSAIIHFKQNY
ncbi:MAG: hypothetical protein AAGG75_12260 [Bacteroidota bacterium]